MRRKKIKATKKNKELIRAYKQEITLEHFLGLEKIKLTCLKCKKETIIRTYNLELYTEEVRKNWLCLLCEYKKKG